jgi:hypothetical protein
MTQQQVQKTAMVTIGPVTTIDKLGHVAKPEPVDGKYGKQWQINCIIAPSMYPTQAWLDQATHPDEPEPGVHTSLLTRGGLKKPGRDGIPKTGASDFDWNWRIEQLDYNGPPIYAPSSGGSGGGGGAPTSPPGTGGSFNYSDPRQASIERQVAMKLAGEIRIASMDMATKLVLSEHCEPAQMFEQANDIVKHIISGTSYDGSTTLYPTIQEWTEFLADALANRVPMPPPEEQPIFEPEPEPVTDSCPHCGDPEPVYTTLPDKKVKHVLTDAQGERTWCPPYIAPVEKP